MEIQARVIEIGPLNTRTYSDRNGLQQTVTSRMVLLKSADDTMYAEVSGDRAVNMNTELNGALCWVRLGFYGRKSQTKDGKDFYGNNVTLYNIEKV